MAKVAGKVYLVGAGPGDPKLITLRGIECIEAADVLVYDRLVHESLIARAKPGAELIYVGKESSRHTMRQEEINELLVERARQGHVVTRLKGGDPFVFGRGGEEAEALVAAGVHFEVVPGITSAVAVPAYAGIPVTHRGLASSFAIITGHEDPAKPGSAIAWDKLATGVDTLVLLMGVENLAPIVDQLTHYGRKPSTPVALIQWGTLPQQRTMVSTLGEVAREAREQGFGPPAVLVVGEVVNLRPVLRWFDNPVLSQRPECNEGEANARPLSGIRVLVTRSREQASALSQRLAELGAEPIEMPTIAIQPPADWAPLDGAIERLRSYDWLVFTSANGVSSFFDRLATKGGDARALYGLKLAAIGPATARALEQRGLWADYVPDEFVAEAVAAGLKEAGVAGKRVLLARAEVAREALVEQLIALGAVVDEVPAYRTVPPETANTVAKMRLAQGEIDVVTFTSSSTVRNLVAMLNGDPQPLAGVTVACIGPITAATAAEFGVRVDIVAQEYTIPGLVSALVDWARSGKLERNAGP